MANALNKQHRKSVKEVKRKEREMEKRYGLPTAIAMVIGIVIGSGVFIKGGKVLSLAGGDMGKAVLDAPKIPVLAKTPRVIGEPVHIAGGEPTITCVSMGNPHCVVFTDGIDDMPLEQIGPKFENDPIFPERVNAEFVEAVDAKTLRMRVWERGSGETWACGTGACAVCVAAVENGISPRDTDITVKLRGGDLTINYHSDGTVIMTGPATFVFDGELV